MAALNLLNNLAISLLVFTAVAGDSAIKYATGKWTGNGLYFLVDAEDAQAKIDAIAASTTGAKQLYVPSEPLCTNIPEGKHVIYMDFGYESVSDLTGQYTLSPHVPMVWVTMPYLSSTPGGDPRFHIPLLKFYTPTDKDQNQCGNVILPFQVADELAITASSIYLRSHGEEMSIDFTDLNPCQEPPLFYHKEGNTIALRSSITGGCPFENADICESPPYIDDASSYCCSMDDVRGDLEANMPTLCASYRSPGEGTCHATIQESIITKWFRDAMLLGDGPITVIASEGFQAITQ